MAHDLITAKAGGDPLADAPGAMRFDEITRMNPARTAIVVSAPGKRCDDDFKVTDMLIAWVTPFDDPAASIVVRKIHQCFENPLRILAAIRDRFEIIATALDVDLDIGDIFREIHEKCSSLRARGNHRHLRCFAESRGEYVQGRITALKRGFTFVDPATFITFNEDGSYNEELTRMRAEQIGLSRLAREGIVVPGFYGSTMDGRIVTFDRGGSDRTMSIVGALTESVICENWKIVPGILAADPKVVHEPHMIDELTYRVGRELTFMGNPVLQKDAIRPAWLAGIPIHVRGVTAPEQEGTWIRTELTRKPVHSVTGIASRTGMSIVTLYQYGMDDIIGSNARTAGIFADAGVSVNPGPGIDSLSYAVETSAFIPQEDRIRAQLARMGIEEVTVDHDIAIICTAGDGLLYEIGASARNDRALALAGSNIEWEGQSASRSTNILRGVPAIGHQRGVRAIYNEFFSR